jgi:hypothetical protein
MRAVRLLRGVFTPFLARGKRQRCLAHTWPRSGLGARNARPLVRVLSPAHGEVCVGITAQPASPRAGKQERNLLALPEEELVAAALPDAR